MIRAGDYLRLAAALPEVGLDALTGGRGVVVLAPHPDDESLGCGGLIAACCAQGIAVRLLVLSDGTGSHPNSLRYPAHRLRELREAELRQAASILGLPGEAVTCLRLPDRHVPTAGPAFDRTVAQVQEAVRDIAAGSLFVTWGRDPHADHQAAFAVARAAAAGLGGVRLLAYPIWGWSLDADTLLDEAPPEGGRLAIGPYRDRKRRAIDAHRSQTTGLIDDDPTGFTLAPEVLARFAGSHEIFVECTP